LSIYPNTGAFVVASGAVLGVSAALSWTAQSSLMLAYPTESQKGLFISIFWSMYNMGGVIGAIMPLGANFHSAVRAI
jgi:sugar phosphate permease